MQLRHAVPANHPIVGDGYRLLADDEVVQPGDQTGCVSCLLSLSSSQYWREVNDDFIGSSVGHNCTYTEDADGSERLFRRRNDP